MGTEKKQNDSKSIKETFEELDSLLKEIENSETSLEKSFELYKKGKELLEFCDKSISDIENEVTVLEE